MTTKISLVHECPICGQTIAIMAGHTIPADITYIKTKRRSVVLVHKNCMRGELQNEHK